MKMLDYYNNNIPNKVEWRMVDCEEEHFKPLCDLCEAIDDVIPDIIKLQEIGDPTIAVDYIITNISTYSIHEDFVDSLKIILLSTLNVWQKAWITSVAASNTALTYPAGVVPVAPISTIGAEFLVLSIQPPYEHSEAIVVFGNALDQYVLNFMLLNTTYRLAPKPEVP